MIAGQTISPSDMAKPIKKSKRSILKKIRKQILSFTNSKAKVFVCKHGAFVNGDSHVRPWAAFVWESGKAKYYGCVAQSVYWDRVSYEILEMLVDNNSELLKK